jgi:hypothetical protein
MEHHELLRPAHDPGAFAAIHWDSCIFGISGQRINQQLAPMIEKV